MENNNGKGLFYGVIGVATLIVAIIGATFAYFTATTASGEYLTGEAAVAGLSVHVTRLTGFSAGEQVYDESGQATIDRDNASYVMVPQLDATLAQAIVGTGSNGDNSGACIDANGSLVCSIYKITVANTGSSAIAVSGELAFYTGPASGPVSNGEDNTVVSDVADSVMNHIKWARLTNPTDVSGNAIPTSLLNYADTTAQNAYEALRPVANDGQTYTNTAATPYLYGRSVPTLAKDLYGTAYASVTYTTENPGPGGITEGTFNVIDADADGQLETEEISAVWVNNHGAHYDLIDPTDDLTYNSGDKSWTLSSSASLAKGTINLQAAGTTIDANGDQVKDDTATFYVVVWISENLASQNEEDRGTFVGQVTFNSAAGSGATSTFTEVAQG